MTAAHEEDESYEQTKSEIHTNTGAPYSFMAFHTRLHCESLTEALEPFFHVLGET